MIENWGSVGGRRVLKVSRHDRNRHNRQNRQNRHVCLIFLYLVGPAPLKLNPLFRHPESVNVIGVIGEPFARELG